MNTKRVYEYEVTVERVVDGDTIILNVDLGFKLWLHKLTCRMAGINASEMNTQAGIEAKTELERMIAQGGGRYIVLSHGLDKYGRWLVDVLVGGGKTLNQLMIERGHAVAAIMAE